MPGVLDDVSCWMRFVPKTYNVNQLTFPGTHDSHATEEHVSWSDSLKENWVVTQLYEIKHQLDKGVRYLDLRVGAPGFRMCHSDVLLEGYLDQITDGIADWLNYHPWETILVSVKWDMGDEPHDMASKVLGIWNKHDWYREEYWPQLKDVQKKAILLRRFTCNDTPGNFGIDFGDIFGKQQHYDGKAKFDQQNDGNNSLTDPNAPRDLWNDVNSHIDSVGHAYFIDGIQHFNVLALNGFFGPGIYGDFLNPALMRLLQDDNHHLNPKTNRFGAIVMDFINQSHCLTILAKNWEQKIFSPNKNQQWYPSDDKPLFRFDNYHDGADDSVEIRFWRDATLSVVRNGETVWGTRDWSVDTKDRVSDQHRLVFEDDGNLCLWNRKGEQFIQWQTQTRPGSLPSRLRFMAGPPYIMIDTFESQGQILWTTCPF